MRYALAAAAMACVMASSADARCRLALALALDVSGSVDAREYQLQIDGVAAALKDAEVQAAFFALPEAPVSLAIYEWSSSSFHRMVLDWRTIGSPADLDEVLAVLGGWSRQPAPEATGLGASMLFGKALLDKGPDCWGKTLDVSGDGRNNDWPVPERIRAAGRLLGITINGLAIATDTAGDEDRIVMGAAELSAYFHARVIQGPGSFVEVALGYENYADAMRRKLLREITVQPLGMTEPPMSRPRQMAEAQ